MIDTKWSISLRSLVKSPSTTTTFSLMFPLSLMDSVLTLEGCLDVRTAGGEILALLSNTIDDNHLSGWTTYYANLKMIHLLNRQEQAREVLMMACEHHEDTADSFNFGVMFSAWSKWWYSLAICAVCCIIEGWFKLIIQNFGSSINLY